jgi:hypothetical protein
MAWLFSLIKHILQTREHEMARQSELKEKETEKK